MGGLGLTRAEAASPPHAKVSEAESSADKPDQEAAPAEQADFGMLLKAEGGGVKNVIGTVTVPADWPDEQRVRVVKQEIPPGATVSYKLIEDVGRQMSVKIPWLPPGKEVRAVVTFEVQRLTVPPLTEDAGRLTCPDARAAGRKMAVYLAPSPKIESDDPQVRKAAQEAVSQWGATAGWSSSAGATAGLPSSAESTVGQSNRGAPGAWEKVQAIHQWVHKNIVFTGDLENVQTCAQTLALRHGVCAELNSLTVAMLRASRFPARLVRIPGHCYYEVYLLDGEGRGHWLAGDASARAAITLDDPPGGMILQKGDNVSIVDPGTHRRVKGRILAESATGTPQTPGVRVQFQSISPAFKTSPSPSGRG
jgi:transglutaminase-like putative cysteine protease